MFETCSFLNVYETKLSANTLALLYETSSLFVRGSYHSNLINVAGRLLNFLVFNGTFSKYF